MVNNKTKKIAKKEANFKLFMRHELAPFHIHLF